MKSATEPDVLDFLGRGDLRVLGLLPHASNFTFLAEVTADGDRAPAVYKPRSGETPLWDFAPGTLCNREVAGYLLAAELGWPNVPPTVLRDGPHGEGSVQLYVEADPEEHYFTLAGRHPEVFRAVAAFDVVVGNGDRKGGHCLLGTDGRIWVVDHGLCFAREPWLRTVIWEFADQEVPQPLRDDLRRVAPALRSGPLRAALLPLLEEAEVDATAERAEGLAAEGRFPAPGARRSHPWPAI